MRKTLATVLLALFAISVVGAAPATAADSSGEMSVLVVRLDFSDSLLTDVPLETVDSSMVAVDGFFTSSSFGAFGISAWDTTEVLRFSGESTDYCDPYDLSGSLQQLASEGGALAQAAGYQVADYDLKFYVFADVSCFSFAAMALIDGDVAWFNHNFRWDAVAHMVGHNVGLRNAKRVDPETGVVTEYGDHYDVMGLAPAGLGELNSASKWLLGWIGDSEVASVSASGTYPLYDLRQPVGPGEHHALTFAMGVGGFTHWVDFQPMDLGQDFVDNAVMVRWVDPAQPGATTLIDMAPETSTAFDASLPVGVTHSDPVSDVHITPVGRGGTDPDHMNVVVNIGPFPDNHVPSISLTADPPSALADETVEFTATAVDIDGDDLAFAWSSEATLYVNSPILERTWSDAGTYPITVVVSDMKGGTTTATMDYEVLDGPVPAPTIEVRGYVGGEFGPEYSFGTWVNEPVLVRYDCESDGAPIVSCPVDQLYDADGQHTGSGVAVDAAGNVSDTVSFDVYIDTTPPTIEVRGYVGGEFGPEYSFGTWVNEPVLVRYDCESDGAPIVSCPVDQLYDADGQHTGSGVAVDAAGNVSDTVSFDVYIDTTPQISAAAGGPYLGTEGAMVALDQASASSSNPADVLTYQWSVDSTACSFSDPTALHPDLLCDDDGTYLLTIVVDNGMSDSAIADANATIHNAPPVLGPIAAPVDPIPVGTQIFASAEFADQGLADEHDAVWDWGDGTTSSGLVLKDAGSGTVHGDHTYAAPGVYTIGLTLTDDGDSTEASHEYVVVFDPAAGFVTGGGWMQSPPGAFVPDPSLTGKATFGFVAKYKKGADVPIGQTHFSFRVADLRFDSTSYDWLVIAGDKAKYKGKGTINGTGNYGFMLTATDDDQVDLLRIKIWDIDAEDAVVYDNLLGEVAGAGPGTPLGGGSIVVHR